MSLQVQFGDFFLESQSRQLTRGGETIQLSPKAFDLLCVLVDRRPSVVGKTELLARVWPGTFVADANLTVLVSEIRQALGDRSATPRFIRTVHRHGYAFCSDARDVNPVPRGSQIETAPRAWLAWNERVLLLSQGENIIGRDPDCSVWLDLPGVSRRHARIVLDGDQALLSDLGSKNGTFVRDSAATAARRIVDGDAICIGPVELRFRMWSDTRSVETVRVPRIQKGRET